MVDADGHKPLLEGGGVVGIDEFCRASGVDPATVDKLARAGRLEGVVNQRGHLYGVLEDELPTAEQLRAWGCDVRSDYAPDDLRGTTEDDPDDEPPNDAELSDTWSMGWLDPAPPRKPQPGS